MKTLTLSITLLSVLAACATPDVVQERQLGDSALTCTQIAAAIQEAQDFKDDARDEKGMTGTNVAAGLLFWPALLVTYGNVEEAVDAADDRQDYLLKLADGKGCQI